MAIYDFAEGVVLVTLPAESRVNDELNGINETVVVKGDRDVVIDFSAVEIVDSAALSNLLILHDLLSQRKRRLILCSVSFPTKCIFMVAGLEKVFEFAEDRQAALEAVQHTG